ncbi:unnamed protein product, partial [Cyprideis torosa]
MVAHVFVSNAWGGHEEHVLHRISIHRQFHLCYWRWSSGGLAGDGEEVVPVGCPSPHDAPGSHGTRNLPPGFLTSQQSRPRCDVSPRNSFARLGMY